MNKSEATNVNLLLRWITGTIPAHWHTGDEQVVMAAQMLAQRAHDTLGAGLRPSDLESAWPKGRPEELAAEEPGPEFPATWSGGHALVIEYGDEELHGRCQCHKDLGSIRPNQSLDTTLAQKWERHVMTEVGR